MQSPAGSSLVDFVAALVVPVVVFLAVVYAGKAFDWCYRYFESELEDEEA